MSGYKSCSGKCTLWLIYTIVKWGGGKITRILTNFHLLLSESHDWLKFSVDEKWKVGKEVEFEGGVSVAMQWRYTF